MANPSSSSPVAVLSPLVGDWVLSSLEGGAGSGSANNRGSMAMAKPAGFAIAMLPRLFAEPDPAPPSNEDKTQSPTNGDNTATGELDDGFAIDAYNNRAGPLLPSISDAARSQKMLLSLDGEINYIRKSISQLGIKTNYLPLYEFFLGLSLNSMFFLCQDVHTNI